MTTLAAERLVLKRGGATLIDGLSLALGPTGAVAVIGPNGAGKSMLIKMFGGVEQPSAGQIRIGGHDLAQLSGAARAKLIGYVPQYFEPHWNLTVDDLLQLGAERAGGVSADATQGVAAQFELAGLRERRWSTLSGGERARVLLAMVLAVDPPVLLADEPGASLDIRHRIDLVQALAKRARDRLSVVVMHDLDLAFRFFDRVIVIERGRIAADGPAGELVSDPRLDAVFGVTFERLPTAQGPLLRAV